MKRVEYISLLTDEDKLRIEFTQDKGKILKFVVQYYALIHSRWRTIMRIDNCHGYPHQHVYYLRAKEFRITLDQDNNVAFTEAEQYVMREFRRIKENFMFNT